MSTIIDKLFEIKERLDIGKSFFFSDFFFNRNCGYCSNILFP